jgi:3-phosphoshikimate 1-carboxyvinyltransferase
MAETIDALGRLGVQVDEVVRPGHLPVTLHVHDVKGGKVEIAGDGSSQFLSGLLLAGPCFERGLEIHVTTELVSRPYVDLTIAVMKAFGAEIDQPDPDTFVVHPTGYRGTDFQIEPDASAASYPLAAAVLCGGRVTVRHLGSSALQGDAAFVDVLERCGADVVRTDAATTVQGTGRLRGGTFDFTHISDTAQTLAAIAPFADSPVTITGIGFIRRKEIDRVAAVATELRRAGVRVDDDPDGWTIHPGPVAPTTFETYDDHRMAMSFALIGLRVPGISIAGPACVAKTFPGYWELLDHLRASAVDR